MRSRAYTAADVQDAIARAFARFATARPRPAYLEVPLDMFSQPAGTDWAPQTLPQRPQCKKSANSEAAVAMLKQAKRPFIILGWRRAYMRARHALRIAEAIRCPDPDHNCWQRCGASRARLTFGAIVLVSPIRSKALQNSDCILAVGTELSETDFWDGAYRLNAPMIRIDIDPDVLARPHRRKLANPGGCRSLRFPIPVLSGKTPMHTTAA